MKRVYVARDVTEAHFVRGLLESHGLEALVQGEDLTNLKEMPLFDTWPTVWVVDDAREPDARAVVRDYESGGPGPGASEAPWVCYRCGERVEAQFTACWKCGAEGGRDR